MSHSHPAGLLAAYNSLTDKHLAGYFNNTRIRRHLLRSGLITRSGRILSEKEYKLNIMKRDHQKYIQECLAQAIFHKVLDMERYHQLEIKKKLETLARKERIQRFKGEHTRRSVENNMPILSPHPPVGPKTNRGHTILVDEGHSSPLALTAPRPYTAPGNMQPPIRLQPLPSNPAVETVPKGKKAVMKFRNSMSNSQRVNSYQLPNINSYMMPIPPPPPPSGKITRENRSETWRRRRFRPTTAPNGLEPLFTRDSRRIHKTSLHSNAAITMIYLGKNVHLSSDNTNFRDEIKVYQQHCGGENLCVYKGKLLEKETFQFISKRHHGFPFSLTFFLNGMQVNRLSSCCEYKHRKGSRLGGKRGYFGFVCVERSSPCYKCIIAMGLDKKTSLPKSRKEKSTEKGEELKKAEGKVRKERKYMIPKRNEIKGNKTSVSAIYSAQEKRTGLKEVITAVEEMASKGKPGQDVWEDDQENTLKYEYEEDFEVDEEKQDEKANEEGQADVQMNGIPKSPLDDKKDNLDPEKESETSSQKAPDAHDNVKDENDGCSESELEEDKQDMKTASSTSSRSHPSSSDSEDESAVGDREAHADNSTDESARSSPSQELSEHDEPGNSHLPIEESLEIEIEDQEITKADVETKPMPIEESFENGLKEGMEKGTQGIAEGLSDKSQKLVPAKEKEKDKSKLWEESTAQVADKKAGLPGVEEGAGQIITEALASGYHCHYDAESGVSGEDEGGKPPRKLEVDTSGGKDSLPLAYDLALGAPTMNLVVAETAAINSNKESQQLTQEKCTPEKKEAMEEEVPQHRDTDIVQGRGEAALWGEAGLVHEAPLRAWKPTAEQSELVEEFTEKREIFPGLEREAVAAAEAEGARRLGEGGSDSTRQAAAKDAVGLSKDEAPEKQALMLTVLETEKAASEGEQGLEKAVLANKAAALNSEHLEEVVTLREAATSEEGEAEGGVAVSDDRESEEQTSIDLEDTEPLEDTAFKRDDGSEGTVLGEKKQAEERKDARRTETPLSPFAGTAEASRVQVSEGSPEDLCKEDAEGEERVTEAEADREDDRKEMVPKELDITRERRKAERPKTPLRKTKSEREEVTRPNALKDEDAFREEQKRKAEEGKSETAVRAEEETAPPKEMGSGAEDEAPVEASELSDNPGLLGEDSVKETVDPIFEATPGFENSLENVAALTKGGEERLNEARDTEHTDGEELSSRENGALEEGPHQEGEGALAVPESEPAGKPQAPEGLIPATGRAEELAAKDHNCGAGMEGRSEGQEGVDVMLRTQEDVPEGDSTMAEKFREEVMDEDPQEEEDKECTLGTEVMQDGNLEGGRDMGGGGNTEKNEGLGGERVVAEEVLHGGGEMAETAAEEREVLAGSETAEEKTIANKASSSSNVTEEETWYQNDELVGKTAAAGRAVVEELEQSEEEMPAAEEMTVTRTTEAGVGTPGALEGKTSGLGQELEAGSEGQEAATWRQESEAAEKFRLGLPREGERELALDSLQAMATHPEKTDFTPEKQQRMVQGEREAADVSPNNAQA
ncbi:glutamate-rich protein 3 isoform X2 [Cebus imitator]|uniref:glutamate-rich protein 3 isoform X2 n=2 Tax=Cebus imitator TaxID=2715852 RepID=UPI00080A0CFD|nr:glutamate-rich protein 3 isoform X2 [Cebus imitator]